MSNNNKIGASLALSFYEDCLTQVVPGLRKKAEQSEFARSEDDIPFLKKLIVFLPEMGFYYANLSDEDTNIKPWQSAQV